MKYFTNRIVSCLFVAFVFVLCSISYAQEESTWISQSYYVPALNGTKLAVDVYRPLQAQSEKLPALLEFTRYWRSKEDPETGEPLPSLRKRDSLFLQNGYALVKVDVRGTGASYGTRPGEYSPTEVRDAWYIVDWVVNQSWSDGGVGAYGTSYSGTTAELLCATGHKAIKAVIPGWSDFDIYESPGRPYGMVATSFVKEWSKIVKWLDNNATDILKVGVRHVSGTVLDSALVGHRDNPDVFDKATKAAYKDSKFGQFTHAQCSPIYWQKEISESGVPMLVLASWLDAGTAEGALLRFQNFTNPQKVLLMPTSHGGKSLASPYLVSDQVLPPVPSEAAQLQMQLDFFEYYLKGKDTGVAEWPGIRYYNYGEEAFRASEEWPPKGQDRMLYYLGEDKTLTTSVPRTKDGQDTYVVDYSVSTGTNNRWTTQMGKPIFHLDTRNVLDAKMRTYTTAPLEEDLQITGTPAVTLHISTTHAEGAVFVYLEDIDPKGQSRYITEGGLLLEHRKLTDNPWSNTVPYHSFKESDAMLMPINKVEELRFKLWPTSVRIEKGHSIRISIAGADIDTFDRVPEFGTPVYKIHRNAAKASFIDLPIVR